MNSLSAEDERPWFSVDEYQHALTRLGKAITSAQRRMLCAHAESPDQTLSVRQLATAGGYATDKATYSQDGHLAKRLVAALGDPERWDVWTNVIGQGFRSGDGELFWRMHPELFRALIELGWIRSSEGDESSRFDESGVASTEREAITLARIGQGAFREALVRDWGSCAVTDVSHQDVLRASHIKPCKRSTDEERLDPCNGLLLAAHLDALFDSGLITFRVDGIIEISSLLSLADQAALGLSTSMKLRRANPGRAKYLAFHREHVFRA